MPKSPAELYETDFYAWTQEQASALRRLGEAVSRIDASEPPPYPKNRSAALAAVVEAQQSATEVDFARLVEEVEDLGKSERNALRSWTTQILLHLLQLQYSHASGPRQSWIDEIIAFRTDVEARLTPSLRRDLEEQLPALFTRAHRRTVQKMTMHGEPDAATRLPAECPYTLDQALGDWWPDMGA
ncbi:DUF29 domain-containing protein [Marinivivus vitaminiproducens]|uniref:DUF29 domain-containing protein n=1 Tax=Marinivivus vitaminiproducens TaxID=3035935 RepID=UPI0027A5C04B|nr:DUF29 domain-containing protein [Geminicoccaceae bacterium SCSIO 64248]